MSKLKALKIVLIVVLSGAIVGLCSLLFTPSFRDVAGYNDVTIRGLYNQPRNSIQVAFLGTSTILSGVSPMALYDEFGFCSYNAGTRAQPFIISYYLLKDIEERNPDTLTTVVVDPSALFRSSNGMNRAEETLPYMDMSANKLEALSACTDYYENFDFFEHLIPILRFHSRWNELEPFDFSSFLQGDSALDFSRHGHFARFNSNLDYEGRIISTAANENITEEITHTDEEISNSYDRGKIYMDKIASFCNEHNLNLVFLKIPKAQWDSLSHDAVQAVADEYGIPFIDMDMAEIWDECDLTYDFDYVDYRHPNEHGATKISHYVGNYLIEHYDIPAVSGSKAYKFMDADLESYYRDKEDAQLLLSNTIEDYLDLLNSDHLTAFITVRGDAAEGLSAEARSKMKSLGLEKLATLESKQSYVGILHNGTMAKEKRSPKGKEVKMRRSFDGHTLIVKTPDLQSGAQFDDFVHLVSEAQDGSNKASVMMGLYEDNELCESKRGINFVVFDNITGDLIDSSSFDTHVGSARTSDVLPTD